MSDDFEFDEFLGDPVPSETTPTKSEGPTVEPTPAAETVPESPSPAAPTESPAPEAAKVDAPPVLNTEIAALLSRERLPAVPGETDAAAMRRLYDHQRQRADRLYYEEVKGAKTAAQAAREELAAFQEAMRPLILAFQERQAEAQRELEQSKIPEQGTAEYFAWQQQQILAKLEQREQMDAEQRAQAEEADRLESMISVDEEADAELTQAINSDPEAREAYEFAVRLGLSAAHRTWPNATPEQLQELVSLSHTLDMRSAKTNGVNVANLFKQRKADVMALLGGGAQPVAPPVPPVVPPAQPAVAANGKAGSPTARQLSTAKSQAAARAVVSPTQPAVAAPTGEGVDFSLMDEDALLDYVLADPSNANEYSRWIAEKHGSATWR